MPTTKSNQLLLLLGFLIILASSGASSSGTSSPGASTFGSTASDEVSVRRPVGNPCDASDYSVSFDESVSLDSVAAASSQASNTGPFELALPEGVYKVTVATWLGEHDLPQETNEQWFFTTNSGYSSPATIDSSPHLLMNQAFDDQEIAATTTIELHHQGANQDDVANEVHPLCIGFDTAGPLAGEDASEKSKVSIIAATDLLP